MGGTRNQFHTIRYKKILWLREHPEFWSEPAMSIKHRMVSAGLCSEKTYLGDLHISDLIQKAGDPNYNPLSREARTYAEGFSEGAEDFKKRAIEAIGKNEPFYTVISSLSLSDKNNEK